MYFVMFSSIVIFVDLLLLLVKDLKHSGGNNRMYEVSCMHAVLFCVMPLPNLLMFGPKR